MPRVLFAFATVIVSLAVWAPTAAAEEEAKPTKATFAPVAEKTSGQTTTCGLSCAVRDAIVGSDQTLSIAVRKIGPVEPVKPVGPRLVLQRQPGGTVEVVSGEEDVKFKTAQDASAQDQFAIDLGGLDEPGEYTGALLFDLSNGADQVSVPVTVKVKDGPLCPLILLVVVVGLGFAFTWIFNQREPAKFRSEAKDLRAEIAALPASDRAVLAPLWNKTWSVRKKDFTLAQSRLKALTAGTEALRECRDAEGEALDVTLTAWAQRLRNARAQLVRAVESLEENYDAKTALVTATREEFAEALAAKDELGRLRKRAKQVSGAGAPDTEFEAAAKRVQDTLDKVPIDAGEPAPSLEPLLGSTRAALAKLEKGHDEEAHETAGVRALVLNGGGGTGGSPPAGDDTMPDSGQGLSDFAAMIGGALGVAASFGVMLVLLAVGFKVTYLDNATFGAAPTDWLTLVFWALTAYGARQTLTGLGPAPPKS